MSPPKKYLNDMANGLAAKGHNLSDPEKLLLAAIRNGLGMRLCKPVFNQDIGVEQIPTLSGLLIFRGLHTVQFSGQGFACVGMPERLLTWQEHGWSVGKVRKLPDDKGLSVTLRHATRYDALAFYKVVNDKNYERHSFDHLLDNGKEIIRLLSKLPQEQWTLYDTCSSVQHPDLDDFADDFNGEQTPFNEGGWWCIAFSL